MSADLNALRYKKACISCRHRKRKCDGGNPCTYCLRNKHSCEYETDRKKAKPHQRRRRPSHDEPGTSNGNAEDGSQLRLLEANSPAVFVRQVGLKINPALAPRLHSYAWNLGLERETACLPQSSGILNVLSIVEMRGLAEKYFVHVGSVYNFLEREYVENAIFRRWQNRSASDHADSMLSGVAALGCLFDGNSLSLETHLAQSARTALEFSNSLPCPEVDHVLGWLLRVIYLRATSSPHATWIASCTLMHMIETTKLHLEPSENSSLAQAAISCQPDLRRRIYWVAQLFNTWVSSDCGKARVDLRGASSELPDHTWSKDQRELCHLSCSLTQKFELEPPEMETEILNLHALKPAQPMLQLLQCNIGLCFFRRARALGRTMPDDSLRLILELAKNSLEVVNGVVKDLCPWWHVLNIPFQLVCVLLVVGTDQALNLLGEALNTLKQVANSYKTEMARESYEIACFLATQERQRRLRKFEHLVNALEGHAISMPTEPFFNTMDSTTYGMSLSSAPDDNLQHGGDMDWPSADDFLLDSFLYSTAT